jgi:hypothetical protein
MNWQGKDGWRLVQQRVETGAASLLVSGNIISIHVGHQHLYLAEQLIGHWPSGQKKRYYKLALLMPAIGHSPDIHPLDGSDNLPFDAELQMPHHLSRSKQSTPFLSTPDGRISQELVVV